MQINSNVKALEGILKAEKRFPDGSSELIFEQENVIVLPAKQILLSAVYQSNQVSDPVTQLKIGIGGTTDPQGLYPKPVSQGIVSLFNQLLTVDVSYSVNNSVPSVTFIADVDQGTANGYLISEAGLSKASGNLFNLKTFPAIPKTAEFSIHFSWTIKMA